MGLTAAPIGQPFDIIRGQDLLIVASFPSTQSISGWLVTFQMWLVSGTNLITKSVGNGIVLTDLVNGVITVTLLAADTANLTPGQYGWHINRTNFGNATCLARGVVVLENDEL